MALVDRALTDVLSAVVDNRGRSCPTVADGFPLIATNCVKNDHLYPTFENIRFVDQNTYNNWFRGHPEPGDILFVLKGSPGRVALVPDPVSFAIAQDMVALRADTQVVDSRYLFYVLRSTAVQDKIVNMHVGTMIPHFKKGDFGKLRFSVHESLEEQLAIAEVLGALDDKIAANRKLIETASELAEALTRGGVEPGRSTALTQVADVVMGSSPAGASLNEEGRGTVFYQGVRDFGFRFPKRRIWTEKITRVGQAGDTLLSVRAPVGRVNLASEPICIGRGLAAIRTAVDSPATLFNLLKAFPEVWKPFEAEGTIFGSINRRQLEGLQVPSVNPTIAVELESRLAELEALITSSLAGIDTLAELRDTLLPELMSGRLRVKDAENKIEEVA